MKKILIYIIIGLIILAVILRLLFLPISHHVNTTMNGYIIYQSGSELNCSVTVTGKYQDYLFSNHKIRGIFDGTIYVNGTTIGIENNRVVFYGETGKTSYTASADTSRASATDISRASSTDINGKEIITRLGDELLNISCDTIVQSCCYDRVNNTDTANETYRCLVIAPAENIDDAKKILALPNYAENLKRFDTWHFQ